MERRKAACQGADYGTDRSATAHASHEFLPHWGDEALSCPGWSEREDDAVALVMRLEKLVLDHRAPLRLPPGLRLECGPAVPGAFQQVFIPSYDEFTASLRTGRELLKPQVPVVVMAGMGPGQWRITADDGLIAEGVIRGE